MPFTPSHVAAVLPLRGRNGRGLPLAALAAGSMSPDLLYFVPGVPADWYQQTHAPWGIVSWDLALGLLAWAAFHLLAPALHDLAPASVRERWRPARAGRPWWWLVPSGVAVGAATHVLWDDFTHANRYASTHIALLADYYASPLGPTPGFEYAQFVSSAAGLAIVAWVGFRRPRQRAGRRRHPRLARFLPWAVAAGGIIGVPLRVLFPIPDESHPGQPSFLLVTGLMGGMVAALAVLGAVTAAVDPALRWADGAGSADSGQIRLGEGFPGREGAPAAHHEHEGDHRQGESERHPAGADTDTSLAPGLAQPVGD